ncbi:hypothetical protein GCM10009696_00620 [Kocuria himachalensis]
MRTTVSNRSAHRTGSSSPQRAEARANQRRPDRLRSTIAGRPEFRPAAASAFAVVVFPAPSMPSNTTIVRARRERDPSGRDPRLPA